MGDLLMVCASMGDLLLVCASVGDLLLVCASMGDLLLVCASVGSTTVGRSVFGFAGMIQRQWANFASLATEYSHSVSLYSFLMKRKQ